MKKCPFCGADIEQNARFCLYCMQSLTEKEEIILHEKKKPQWMIIIAAIVAVFLIVATILLVRQIGQTNKAPAQPAKPASQADLFNTPPADDLPHVHDFSLENPTAEYLKEEATCMTPALFYYSCACGEKGSDIFTYGKTAEHTIVTEQGQPATCKTPGLTDGTHCSVCNTVLSTQSQIPVVGHTYDNDQDDRCNVCNFVRVLNCDHGKTITLSAVSATCTAGGLTEGRRCALCEEILTAQSILAPLGHKEATDQGIAPTCTTSGKTEGKHCATCNTVLVVQVILDAKGHTEVIDPAIDPTCTDNGKTQGKHCATCKTVLVKQITIKATGHTSVDDPTVEATCTTTGSMGGKHCSECNAIIVRAMTIKAKGHTEVIDQGKPATCTTDGTTDGKHCSVCNEVLVAQTVVKAKGHTVVPTPAVAATCTTDGKTEGKHCSACNAVFVAQTTIKAKGHVEVIDPAVAAGCETPGKTEGKHCSVCQQVIKAQNAILMTGHTYYLGDSSHSCLTCGAVGTIIVNAPQFPFFVNNKTIRVDGGYYVVQRTSENCAIKITIRYTNVSNDTISQAPKFILDGVSLEGGPTYPPTLAPNESGSYQKTYYVYVDSGSYDLVFDWGK